MADRCHDSLNNFLNAGAAFFLILGINNGREKPMTTKDHSPGCDSHCKKRARRVGIVRQLPPDDPRNIHHQVHREKWLALARAIGEGLADEAYERDLRAAKGDESEGSDLREVLQYSAKGPLH
jgi:hypothetical protein